MKNNHYNILHPKFFGLINIIQLNFNYNGKDLIYNILKIFEIRVARAILLITKRCKIGITF